MAAGRPRVTLYTGPGCSHCKQARAFLRQHQVPFQEFDVARNRRAGKEFERLGARGVPVILIGRQRLDGFVPGRLKKALREAGFSL